jgi:hypothetical protein
VNARAETKDRYGTLFEFNSTATSPFEEFTAIRRHTAPDAEGKPVEKTAKYAKQSGTYLEHGDPLRPFKLSSSEWMVTAVEIPQGESKARFEAELFVPVEGKPGELRPAKPEDANPTYNRGAIRTFREANGTRYIEFSELGTPGPIQSPSKGAWLGAVLLNLAHFAVWYAVFWPILRFTSGPAFGLAAGTTALVMFFVMPILFERHKPAPPAATAFKGSLPSRVAREG